MTVTIVSAVVPMLSVLLGAWLTYIISVRTRRSNHAEDLFDAAIAATAVADASQYYMSGIGRPTDLPTDEYRAVINAIIRSGVENHVKRVAEAREAIARVIEYEPRLRPYYQDPVIKGDRPQEIIRLLQEGKSHVRRAARTRRGPEPDRLRAVQQQSAATRLTSTDPRST